MILLCAVGLARVEANDAAVETAAGGLQLRNERRVSILKERLQIRKQFISRVPSNLPNLQNRYPIIVEYDFINESTKDVTTVVAFPLPEFSYPWEDLIQDRRVRGFKVEVDGKVVPYATEVRAVAGGSDVTDILRKSGIEIESFGRFDHNTRWSGKYQVERLSKETQVLLKTSSAVDNDLDPKWGIAITHYWKQTFPARKVIKVRHEYDAIPGFSYGYEVRDYLSYLKDGCFDAGLTRGLEAAQARAPKSEGGVAISAEWVKYILTTANTWKVPIRDFELIAESPQGQFVSFCWRGKVEKISNTQFRATARDFVPNRELLVYFLSVGK
jgi:hypothetical protein